MKKFKPYICFILFSFMFANNNLELGRDSDPKTIHDIGKFKKVYKKTLWSTLSILGPRNISKLIYPKSINHIPSENSVAFTIDDGFCGIDNPNGSMINEVRLLLDKYNARATFFVTGSHTDNINLLDIDDLLIDGHELANHNMYDIPYNKYSEEDFEKDLQETSAILKQYTDYIPSWYRPPHAKMSKNMQKVIDKYNLKLVLGDVFANDTSIPDPEWIAKYILNKVKPGSIIIIHMPEKGVREWNYKAMELILEGLVKKNLNILTLTELYESSTN